MSQFLETLYLCDGRIRNLTYHQQRYHRTRHAHYGISKPFPHFHNRPNKGMWRIRLLYDQHSEVIEYIPYKPRHITSLKCISADIAYDFKYANRTQLNQCITSLAPNEDALIIRDGWITDTTIANIALSDGHHWYTPKNPLLKGTMRARLIDSHWLRPKHLHIKMLHHFKAFGLMNALSGFYVVGPTTQIKE